ncbi:DUF6286 domain-containing protein [Saccharomonospora saliphila]|uniref:DUF6286 domain-containing protein n=1 Tax=Saccharomonospora saliphila TaxID=369829 RepID=UPI00038193B8|nr:DUF6286 domain-containing protein [Saccharomonospora saliphila]
MRIANRLLTAVLSLVLIAAGVLLIIEVVAAGVGAQPVVWDWRALHRWADDTAWQDGVVQLISLILLVVGLVLLLAELKRPRLVRLRARPIGEPSEARPVDTAYTRRGVATAVRSAVADLDGVRSARVSVKRRVVRVTAKTASHDRASVQELRRAADEAARARLADLDLRSAPSIKIRTRSV